MASSKTRIKPIRITNEVADYFEGKPLNRMVESLCWLIQKGKIGFDGENLKVEGVYTEKSEKISEASPKELEEIESMAVFFGITAGEFLKGVCDGMMDGNLSYENGKVVGVPELDLENLYDVCHERGISPQEAIDKTVKNLRSGK